MADTQWVLDESAGELLLHTGVSGRAAKMGHRLTVAMDRWRAVVTFAGDVPAAVELDVDVDSFRVLRGEGGLTPLTPPEKALVRINALSCFEASRYPQIRFRSTDITACDGGYRLTGALTIHGRERDHEIELHTEAADGRWRLTASSEVRHGDFGIRPYSMLMGAMKVAESVTVTLAATTRG